MMDKQSLLDQKHYALEAPLTKAVKEYLELEPDIHFYKASDRYHSGVSDIIACVKGWLVVIELKADNYKPTAEQKLFIKQVEKAGGIGGVCYTLGDVKLLIERARMR